MISELLQRQHMLPQKPAIFHLLTKIQLRKQVTLP